jgi:polyphosphate kinase
MRSRFLELVQREIENKHAGKYARIIAKMNQLEDPEMIKALCQASCAGVPVDLIIRGFCCLKPGVAGETENIRVRSIIGRFLEHSRVYYFANGQEQLAEGDFYIGSADWMYRNLSKRIEVVTPVHASVPKQRLAESLEIFLNDTRQGWQLNSDGNYQRIDPHSTQPGTHRQLMNLQTATV